MKAGILGAGQLGRMLALAAHPLGIEVSLYDPAADACAGQVARHVAASFGNREALLGFAEGLDVVTFEWENVPVAAADIVAEKAPFLPATNALAAAQDRLTEKTLFRECGIETAPFVALESRDELHAALGLIGVPAVLKTRRMGYDGKGQFVLRDAADEEAAWHALGGAPLILEGFVPFQRELSVICARSGDDERFYPLTENHHVDGILRLSIAPAPRLDEALQAAGENIARRVARRLNYIGVLAIELFEHEGRLLANEMATRVHNSGHWTIDGAVTSQFENHMRAVTGLPLGSTAARGLSAMVNLIGDVPRAAEVLAVEGAHLHLYGKEPRSGRKLGHINVTADDESTLQSRLVAVQRVVDASASKLAR
ncbi:MAG TPA: 5-(carboxyamino)imidazole ribonucleotide synthase [Dehalococcoidia bacterium]|nr:5-(carboxyamino)imidazole ribonucleotide synthase [Dehalococcoidia bacterium]